MNLIVQHNKYLTSNSAVFFLDLSSITFFEESALYASVRKKECINFSKNKYLHERFGPEIRKLSGRLHTKNLFTLSISSLTRFLQLVFVCKNLLFRPRPDNLVISSSEKRQFPGCSRRSLSI